LNVDNLAIRCGHLRHRAADISVTDCREDSRYEQCLLVELKRFVAEDLKLGELSTVAIKPAD
jgi:hypothetical protein